MNSGSRRNRNPSAASRVAAMIRSAASSCAVAAQAGHDQRVVERPNASLLIGERIEEGWSADRVRTPQPENMSGLIIRPAIRRAWSAVAIPVHRTCAAFDVSEATCRPPFSSARQ